MTTVYSLVLVAMFCLTFLLWVNVFTGTYHRRGWAPALLYGEAFIAATCVTFIFRNVW